MAHSHRLDGSKQIRLSQFDPDETGGLSKEEAVTRTAGLGAEWSELEDLLFFAGQHSLIILLQGMDTSGKDGAIRRILDDANAQSCRVESFKAPTADELTHDFLWRIHARTPGRGSVAIFNRSHYEDVLVVRVHKLAPEEEWRRRYQHINHFESLLLDNDTILLKFFLHISKEEQKERLLEREEETEKAWKLNVGDWREREYWNDYHAAYQDALNRCATEHAPWYVVPANHKWYRNLAVLERIVETLRPYREQWLESLRERGATAVKALTEYRTAHPA